MRKENIISSLNKIIRDDPYINDLAENLGLELEEVEALGTKIYKNMFLDTLDEDLGIPLMLDLLNIQTREGNTVEEKRSMIQAKWKSKGKCSEELLQLVAESWKNGEVTISFENDLITVRFASLAGVPTDIDTLKSAINEIKPAYLLVDYIFNWLYWDLFDSFDLTWDELDSCDLTWDELEITIVNPTA